MYTRFLCCNNSGWLHYKKNSLSYAMPCGCQIGMAISISQFGKNNNYNLVIDTELQTELMRDNAQKAKDVYRNEKTATTGD